MASGEIVIKSDNIQEINSCNRVIAGPGAGKTYWLIGQIRHILQSNVLHSTNKIACITYTNKAALNIEEQIGRCGNNLYVSTIHAFLYAFVIKPFFHFISEEVDFDIQKLDGHNEDIAIGHSSLTEIIPPKFKYNAIKFKEFTLLKRYIERYHWHLTDKGIDLCSAPCNQSPLKGFGKDQVLEYKKYVWEKYGLMHHDDVLYFSYNLVKKYPNIITFIASKFPYILIDEYQDTNSIQHYFFQCLAKAGVKVTIIGDQAQSIYRFAGSDINNLTSFTASNLRCYKIEDNRRSTPSILNFLNIIRTDLHQNALLDKDYGVPVILIGTPAETYQRAKLLCNNEKLTSLCWSNATANMLKLSISYCEHDKLTKCLLDETSDRDRARFTYNCLLAVENARLFLMKDALNCIFKAFRLDKRLLEHKQIAFKLLLKIVHMEEKYRNSTLKDFYDIINDLRNEKLPRLQKGKDADLFAHKYLEFAKDIRCNDEDSDHLTIHKAKGLEFDNVILIFYDIKDAMTFLLHSDLNAKQDDSRLYYVACSRAKHRLFISVPSLDDEQKNLLISKYANSIAIK